MKTRAKIPPRHRGAYVPPEPGEAVDDGSIYLGCFGDKDWYVAAEDVKDVSGQNLMMTFNEASRRAKESREHGRNDWRLPPGLRDNSKSEPDIQQEMYKARHLRAFNGTYDESGDNTRGWYWSSTTDGTFYWGRIFSDNRGSWRVGGYAISARFVRAVPKGTKL